MPFSQSLHWRGIGVIFVVFQLVACGSTVQSDRYVATTGAPQDGLSGIPGDTSVPGLSEPSPPATSGGAEAGGPLDLPMATQGNAEGAGNSRGGTSSAGGSNGRDAPVVQTATGRGFNEREIFVGYYTAKGAKQAFDAFGASSVDYGDQEAQAKAVIADINARGGVAGRKLMPVFYDYDYSATNPSANAQAACTRWTQDRPVFAVVVMLQHAAEDELSSCLAKRQTILINATPWGRPNAVYSRYSPYLYGLHEASLERQVPVWLQRLRALGYFTGWDTNLGRPTHAPAKVGILSYGALYGPEFTKIVRTELGKLSQHVAATFDASGDTSQLSNEMSAAVLRFREAGVTHVIPPPILMTFFMPAAASQNYRPRYAVDSGISPLGMQSFAPVGQLSGAMGVGWIPTADVDNARHPSDVGAAESRCRKVMESAGQGTSARDAFRLMVRACDGLNFLATAIAHGGLSPLGVRNGVAALGSLPSAATFNMTFPSGRPQGASAVRDLAYREDCSCFEYLSKTNHRM